MVHGWRCRCLCSASWRWPAHTGARRAIAAVAGGDGGGDRVCAERDRHQTTQRHVVLPVTMAPLPFGERWGALGAMRIVTLALALTPVLAAAVRRKPREIAPLPRPRMTSAPGRIRTCDTWLRRPLLYPLSYGRGPLIVLARGACGPERRLAAAVGVGGKVARRWRLHATDGPYQGGVAFRADRGRKDDSAGRSYAADVRRMCVRRELDAPGGGTAHATDRPRGAHDR